MCKYNEMQEIIFSCYNHLPFSYSISYQFGQKYDAKGYYPRIPERGPALGNGPRAPRQAKLALPYLEILLYQRVI